MRKMKDSGIEWIGEIPEGWSKNKVIRLFDIIGSGTTPKNITSDFPVVKDCIAELKKYGVPVEAKVMSAHRTPGLASEFASKAKAEGFGVIICAAGMAAHLAGVIAGHTTLPVIGIPIRSSFEGLDALLATVQMPSGIPVATVAVNGAKNAAVLAVQMLALSDEELSAKLEKSKKDMIDGVIAKNEKLQKMVDEL